jgi:signal peptidase I
MRWCELKRCLQPSLSLVSLAFVLLTSTGAVALDERPIAGYAPADGAQPVGRLALAAGPQNQNGFCEPDDSCTVAVTSSTMEPTLHSGQSYVAQPLGEDPARGTVVILRAPQFYEGRVLQIYRIVGLPGEVIAIEQGSMWINGEPLDEQYVLEPMIYTFALRQMSADDYFVLGDNRNNSADSQIWGPVPRSALLARIDL